MFELLIIIFCVCAFACCIGALEIVFNFAMYLVSETDMSFAEYLKEMEV